MKYLSYIKEVKDVDRYYFGEENDNVSNVDPYGEEKWDEPTIEYEEDTEMLKFFKLHEDEFFFLTFKEGISLCKIVGGKRKEKIKKKNGKLIRVWDVDEVYIENEESEPGYHWVYKDYLSIWKIYQGFEDGRKRYLKIDKYIKRSDKIKN